MSDKDEQIAEDNIKRKKDALKAFGQMQITCDEEHSYKLQKNTSSINLDEFKKRSRDEKLRRSHFENLPDFIQQKATLISAHFLLPNGSKVADMGCGDGIITYALALLNPRIEFLGIDRNNNLISQAKSKYELLNLKFRCNDVGIENYLDEGLDGIINSNILHEVYSENGYSINAIVELLELQLKKLKPGGVMLIRDYIMPPLDKYILLEFPDNMTAGKTAIDMSDAELLVNFSETARPAYAAGCEGFFLEELQDTFRENTRLFRLPEKWALEFIYRKDERKKWDRELKQEYSFFTYDDYMREFSKLGMRILYTAPYWNPWIVKERFKGHFQIYDENGKALPPPPTNHFLIAMKAGEKGSLIIEERRPIADKSKHLEIVTVRNKKDGSLQELVREPEDFCDILPYRITNDGRLIIYIHTGVPRPIVNAVARGNSNLDGKIWSGHLVENITMDIASFGGDAAENKIAILKYLEKHVGLIPRPHGEIDIGLPYFPDPETIDEAIEAVYIEVCEPQKKKWPFSPPKELEYFRYSEMGYIYEIEAHDILYAAQIGVLPDPRLEIRVYDLMVRLGIAMPRWLGEQMPQIGKVRKSIKGEDGLQLLDELEKADFEEVNREPEHLKVITSLFVEDGYTKGQKQGITSQKVDFVITDDGIENIAIVLPLTHGWDDGLLAALDPKMLSVPQRMGGSGAMLTAPSFVLPKDVHTIEDAKQFIANKFSQDVDKVFSLGESYFTHTSVTPRRVFPFAIMADAEASLPPNWKYTSMRRLWALIYCFQCFSGDLLKAVARTHMALGEEHSMTPEKTVEFGKTRNFKLSLEKEELYQAGLNSEHRIPSRILGEGKFRCNLNINTKEELSNKIKQVAEKIVDVSDKKNKTSNIKDNFISLDRNNKIKELDTDISKVKKRLQIKTPQN